MNETKMPIIIKYDLFYIQLNKSLSLAKVNHLKWDGRLSIRGLKIDDRNQQDLLNHCRYI